MQYHAITVAQLPPVALVQLLSKLGQEQLGVASLVCKSWREASLVALAKLRLVLMRRDTAELPVWLRNRAPYLQHLVLAHQVQNLDAVLPFDASFKLSSLTVQFGTLYDSSSDPLISLQQTLTALELYKTGVDSQFLCNVAALTNLRTLSLLSLELALDIGTDMEPADPDIGSSSSISEAANSIWSNLQQLTTLVVTDCGLEDSDVEQVTKLSSLQHLDLSGNNFSNGDVLAHLSGNLTCLDISSNFEDIDCSAVLGHASTTKLQSLSISGLTMSNPSQLTSFTHLTKLAADNLSLSDSGALLSALPILKGLQHLSLCGTFGDQQIYIEDLNTALQLPQLTVLKLGQNTILPRPPGDVQSSSAVLASTSEAVQPPQQNTSPGPPGPGGLLRSLWTRPLGTAQQSMDQAPVAPHLFSTSRMPNLHMLSLDCYSVPEREWVQTSYGSVEPYFGPGTQLTPNHQFKRQELRDLADRWPGLMHLSLMGRLHESVSAADLMPLTQLNRLASLSIGGIGFPLDDDMLKVIATMTTLQILVVVVSPKVTDLGVMGLTKLTALKGLKVVGLGAHNPLTLNGSLIMSRIPAIRGMFDATEVWEQLHQRCRASRVCLLAMDKAVQGEVEAAKARIAANRAKEKAATAKKKAVAAEEKAAAAANRAAAAQQEVAAAQGQQSVDNSIISRFWSLVRSLLNAWYSWWQRYKK